MSLSFFLMLVGALCYERGLEVHNPSDSGQTDVQVLVKLDMRSLIEAGKLDREGFCLRFIRDGNYLHYWIADSVHTCSTGIWLKFDSLSPGLNKLTMLYADSTDGYRCSFDSIFTKTSFDSTPGWVFHCDDGKGSSSLSANGDDNLILEDVEWSSKDGGGWGSRDDRTFSSGSALHFKPGSDAYFHIPEGACQDSFTFAIWLRLDTLEYLTYSNGIKIIAELPGLFSLWLKTGSLGLSIERENGSYTCFLPPFGWERVGKPDIDPAFILQGLTTVKDKLLFSAYRRNPLLSRVWRIDPLDLMVLDWFDMPWDATHTSGLAYDSTRGILWASDYDSGKLYALDPDSSFATHKAFVRGEFKMYRYGVSACCMAPFRDTLRLVVSCYSGSGQTYILDEDASLLKGEAEILAYYDNVGHSQGLAYDGEHLWEAGLRLTCLDIEDAVKTQNYKDGLLLYSSQLPWPEDITFLQNTLWMPSEYYDKALFRFTDDPRKFSDRWLHVAATYDGQSLKLYLNGDLVSSGEAGRVKGGLQESNLYIGGRDDGKSSFEGTLDEIVILSKVLDSSGVRALCERRKPTEGKPVSKLDEKEDSLPDLNRTLERTSKPLAVKSSSSKLTFTLPYKHRVKVDLFDVSGRRVANLLHPQELDGKIDIYWPSFITNGVYYVVFQTPEEIFSRKVVILR